MVESVASKRVLDPHPAATAAGAGIIGVGVGVTTCVGVITTLLFAATLRRSPQFYKKWGGSFFRYSICLP